MVHFVPKSSEISWGFCVPSSCSSEDISSVLKMKIVEITNIPDSYWKVKVRDGNCQVKDERWIRNLTAKEIAAM